MALLGGSFAASLEQPDERELPVLVSIRIGLRSPRPSCRVPLRAVSSYLPISIYRDPSGSSFRKRPKPGKVLLRDFPTHEGLSRHGFQGVFELPLRIPGLAFKRSETLLCEPSSPQVTLSSSRRTFRPETTTDCGVLFWIFHKKKPQRVKQWVGLARPC